MTVEPARTQWGLVQYIGSISGCQYNDAGVGAKSVQLGQ
jgi:hypothetical protein